MSDPADSGYECCCRPMTGVELPNIYDGVSAYLCDICGVWRNRWLRADPRRVKVDHEMMVMVNRMFPKEHV